MGDYSQYVKTLPCLGEYIKAADLGCFMKICDNRNTQLKPENNNKKMAV